MCNFFFFHQLYFVLNFSATVAKSTVTVWLDVKSRHLLSRHSKDCVYLPVFERCLTFNLIVFINL